MTVEIGDGTETWTNSDGATLFAREKTDHSEMWSLTLPADENRSTPTLDYSCKTPDGLFSFNLDGSMIRGKTVLPPGMSEEDFSPVTGEDEEEEEQEEAPQEEPQEGEEPQEPQSPQEEQAVPTGEPA